MRNLSIIALTAMILTLVIPFLGVVSPILYILFLLEIDKKFTTKLVKLYITRMAIGLLICFILYLGYLSIIMANPDNYIKIIILFGVILLIGMLYIANVVYQMGIYIKKIRLHNNSNILKYCHIMINVATFTIPIFVGGIFLYIADILLAITFIIYEDEKATNGQTEQDSN